MPALIFDFDGTLADITSVTGFVDQKTADLCREFSLVLVTACSSGTVADVCRKTGIDRLLTFVEVISAENGGNRKRTGEPFLEVQARYKDIVAVIGDSESDRAGAEIAGVPFIRVRPQPVLALQKEELRRCVEEAGLVNKKLHSRS